MRIHKRRGSAIVFALLISLLLAVVGLYLIGTRRGVYATARASVHQAQARALAQAGMEDMLVKLAKDPFFPTGVPDEQKIFSYQESMPDPDNPTQSLGLYQCTVDRTRDSEKLVFLLSVGSTGDVRQPTARQRVAAVLDLKTFKILARREGEGI